MKFLESLYNIENFGIYLFIVIGGLVIVFLVILFFGKKDEQKRKEMHEKDLPKADFVTSTDEPSFKETSIETPLEMKIEEEKEEPVKELVPEEIHVPEKDSLFEAPPASLEQKSLKEENKDFDFDALAEAISKELESLDNEKNSSKPISKIENTLEEEIKTPILEKEEEKSLNYQVFEPIEIKEESKEAVVKPVEPVYEEKKLKPSMPTVFSSVYVNREKEEPIRQAPQEVIEEPEMIKPVAPKIELPKMMDLPRKK